MPSYLILRVQNIEKGESRYKLQKLEVLHNFRVLELWGDNDEGEQSAINPGT